MEETRPTFRNKYRASACIFGQIIQHRVVQQVCRKACGRLGLLNHVDHADMLAIVACSRDKRCGPDGLHANDKCSLSLLASDLTKGVKS